MSTPRVKSLQSLIDRVLGAHEDDPVVDLAASLGIDKTYVSKLRGGYRPTRVSASLYRALVAADPDSTQARRRSDGVYGQESSRYAASVLRIIERQARAIADSAAEAQRVLEGTSSRLSADEIADQAREAVEEVRAATTATPAPGRKRA